MTDTAPEPMISMQVVKALADRLSERGLPVSRLLSSVDIAQSRLANANDYVPLRRYVQLFELSAAACGEPLFGLTLAATAGPETLGALGFLFLSATSLGDALENLGRYMDVFQDATENSVSQQGAITAVSYRIRDDRIAPRRQDAEFSVGLMLRLIRAYAGDRVAPIEVHLEHGPGAPDRLYRGGFGCPVYFRQPCNAVVLQTADLAIRSGALSDKLHEVLEVQLRSRLSDRHSPTSFSDRVASGISPQSLQDKVSASRIARDLRISDSTLYRRLQRERTSYKDLVTARRAALAKRLLDNSSLSIAEIACALGYAENASFTRAFKRWTSISPQEFRKTAAVRTCATEAVGAESVTE